MQRQRIIAANWKMHGSRASVAALLEKILAASAELDVKGEGYSQIVVFPPYVFLEQVQHMLAATPLHWGGQNVSQHAAGAFTGEISAAMLADFGCSHVLVGHSERRQWYGEDNALVALKFLAAVAGGLQPVLCVGETLAEREAGDTDQVIKKQLDAVFAQSSANVFANAIIAYEPCWAIGTGVAAQPEQVQQVHAMIRAHVKQQDAAVGEKISIVYGGSLKASNAAALFAMPDIDGGLIGSASLNPQEFLEIIKICNNSY